MSKNRTDHSFAFTLSLMMVGICLIVFFCLYDATTVTELAVFMAGQFFTGMLACLGYFVGTTQSSREKTNS